eukprot:2517971-Amphidinium_carterae.1
MRHALPTDAEFFICDFSETFWQIPLHKSEQPRYAGVLKGQVLIYERTAQGSRCDPLSWAAAASKVLRLTQSLFYELDAPD